MNEYKKEILTYDSEISLSCYFFLVRFSGPGGNRTRVRKSIPWGISHHSYSFDIPLQYRRITG